MSYIRLAQTRYLPKKPARGGKPAIDASETTNAKGLNKPPFLIYRNSDKYIISFSLLIVRDNKTEKNNNEEHI